MNVNPNRQNVEKVFYSKRNFNMLCSVIRDTVNKKYGVDPKDNYKKDIYKTMNIVIGRAVVPTTRVNVDMYNRTLNKKVLSQIIPMIDRDITTTLLNTSHQQPQHLQPEQLPQPSQSTPIKDIMAMSIQSQVPQPQPQQPLPQPSNSEPVYPEYNDIKVDENPSETLSTNKPPKPIRISNENDIKDFTYTSQNIKSTITPASAILNKAKETVNRKLEEKSIASASISTTPQLTDINDMDINNYNPRNVGNGFNQGGFPLIRPPKTSYIPVEHYITIDSRSRNLEVYPSANNFQVKFAPASDKLVYRSYKDSTGMLLYEGNVRFHGDNKGANIDIKYNNVYEIECLQATVPYAVKYVCGDYPSQFNGGTTDANLPSTTDNFGSYRYGPVWSSADGLRKNVLDVQYLLLSVEEIDDGPYKGTNLANTTAFSKLFYDNFFGQYHSFIQMKPAGNESKRYEPSALASLTKMTLGLRKWNNLLYDFGVDKTYVASYTGVSGDSCQTEITIDTESKDYPCGSITSHGLEPGDLLYFFDTVPELCDQEVMYFTNNPRIVLEKFDSTLCLLMAFIMQKTTTGVDVERCIDFSQFITIGDYIYIKYETSSSSGENVEYLQVIGFNDDYSLIVTEPSVVSGDEDDKITNITKIGWAKPTKRGRTSNNTCNLNYLDGIRVCEVKDATTFVVNFPYENLTYMQKQNYEKSVFFIKHKLQVNYTFRVVTLEKNFDQLESQIVR